jgi:hypothetical protein
MGEITFRASIVCEEGVHHVQTIRVLSFRKVQQRVLPRFALLKRERLIEPNIGLMQRLY